ncbi:MAG: hypothetical protein ACI4SF_16400 [Oscillospiraceae bacterium]
MGLLDKLKSFVDNGGIEKISSAVAKTVNTLADEAKNSAQAQETSAAAKSSVNNTPSASGSILSTGNVPPKPYFTVEEEFGDKEYSFELSKDFIPFNSHSEFEPSYQYEPFSDDEYTEYDGNLPVLAIGPDDTVYKAAESFEKNGSVSGLKISESSNPCFLFSTFFEKYGLKYYAYAFAGGTAREYEMLCIQYKPDLSGTALEKKLIAALDKAADTYKESN